MEVIGVTANVVDVIDLSAKVGTLCIQYCKNVKNAGREIERFQNELGNLRHVAKRTQELLDSPQGAKLVNCEKLRSVIGDSVSQLEALRSRLMPRTSRKAMSKIGIHALKWPFNSREVSDWIQRLGRHTEMINQILQIEQTSLILDIQQNVLRLDRKLVFDNLPIALGASFDSLAEEHNPICLPNTRVHILQQIYKWANGPCVKHIFWLSGMAGTGKSTISRTVGQHLARSGHLAVSFFFKRGEADRSSLLKFFTTISAQLAEKEPAIVPYIKAAVENDVHISGKAVRDQFEKLILQPLKSAHADTQKLFEWVLIVDALDECDRDEDSRFLIDLLSGTEDLPFLRLRILITSRPELPIRLGFNIAKNAYEDLVLHEIPTDMIRNDISVFFEYEIEKIKTEYNSSVSTRRHLPLDWPGEGNIQLLINMAVPLFIFAATVCRFLADRKCGNPDKQLKEVLNLQQECQVSQLSATYLPVMNRLVDGLAGKERNMATCRFQHIVGSIIILKDPLSTSALAEILDVEEALIEDQLDLLHSVMHIPSSNKDPVRLLHLSFREFLVNREQRGDTFFWVDEQQKHAEMAMACLRIMKKCLQKDMCQLGSPGNTVKSITSSEVDEHMPPELQYACLYWAYHTQQGHTKIDDCEMVHLFLKSHFLHWVEALSLIKRTPESIKAMELLTSIPKVKESKILADFLEDAIKLILTNLTVISLAPLQIYSSVLAFSPASSSVRKTFFKEGQIPKWMLLLPEPEENWEQCQQVLEDKSWVNSVGFSHDSSLVASACEDNTIRLWRVEDGECIHELKGHEAPVRSVAFSHDSKFLASTSDDGTARLWRVEDRVCTKELQGHRNCTISVAFSQKSTLGALVSKDNTIQLYCMESGNSLRKFHGHEGHVRSIAFSYDLEMVASASDDRTIRVWSTHDGTCINELKYEEGWVEAVAFSHDGKLIASAANDGTIRVMAVADGNCIQELKGHKTSVPSIDFSHDSTLLASAAGDKTVRLWSTTTGQCIRELKGHGHWVNSVAFSHDSTVVASSSNDKTIRLWSVENGRPQNKPKDHNGAVISITLSEDLKLVASTSSDRTIRLWRVDTGKCIRELKGNGNWVTSVIFSRDTTMVASIDTPIQIWTVEDGKCIRELKEHKAAVRSLAFSNDSKLLASGSDNGVVSLWCVNNGQSIQQFAGHQDSVLSMSFSQDSKLVASAAKDGTIRVWRADNGTCTLELKAHRNPARLAIFSQDSVMIASASSDKTIKIWRVENGEFMQEFKGYHGWVNSMAFSPDSALVASAIDDNTIWIWRVKSGECLQRLQGIKSSQIQFDSTGHFLLTDSGKVSFRNTDMAVISDPKPNFNDFSGIGINEDRSWIMWREKKLFWLPVLFRPTCVKISGATVVFGCETGKVISMAFSELELNKDSYFN